ncbi:LysR family transcriptional regulator [Pantoea osteomyelitidis]|uniref:LysR family transcriptional regulator n=1 Tax=Pantoea osteomyelitidis TaxID=3230026 RepID=A0ABW7Q0U6_9GAMM
MANLNLEHLATFRLVVSRGSFSAAANVLELSQPAVSLQIKQLEQMLQTRLLERTGRGVQPTAAGLSLLAHSGSIDQAVSAAVHAVTLHMHEVSGTVTVGTGATACIHLMPPVLQQLRQAFPLLSIKVRTGNTQEIARAIDENQIDIGLVTLPVTGRNLHISPIMQDEFVMIREADGSEAIQTLTPGELLALPLIVFASGSSTRALIDSWFATAGEVAQPVMELGSIEAIKRMVRAGLGYSIVPRMSVTADADRAGLRVDSLTPALHRTLGTVMRQDKIINRGMTEIMNALRQMGISAISPGTKPDYPLR